VFVYQAYLATSSWYSKTSF